MPTLTYERANAIYEKLWEIHKDKDWHLYEQMDLLMELYGNPMPEQFLKEWDAWEMGLEAFSALAEVKRYEQIMQLLDAMRTHNRDWYLECAEYAADDALKYNLYRRNAELQQLYWKDILDLSNPNYNIVYPLFWSLLFYDRRALLQEYLRHHAEEKIFSKGAVAGELKNEVHLFATILAVQMSMDEGNYNALHEPSAWQSAMIATGLPEAYILPFEETTPSAATVLTPEQITAGQRTDLSGLDIGDLQPLFYQYAHSQGLPVAVSYTTWQTATIELPDNKRPREPWLLKASFLIKQLDQWSDLFTTYPAVQLASLWGMTYLYDFLWAHGVVTDTVYHQSLGAVQDLKQKAMHYRPAHLWQAHFITDWQAPVGVEDETWREEMATLERSFELPNSANKSFLLFAPPEKFDLKPMTSIQNPYRQPTLPNDYSSKSYAGLPEAKPRLKIGRNVKVTVRYEDGTLKSDVKYKKVMKDVEAGWCEVIERSDKP